MQLVNHYRLTTIVVLVSVIGLVSVGCSGDLDVPNATDPTGWGITTSDVNAQSKGGTKMLALDNQTFMLAEASKQTVVEYDAGVCQLQNHDGKAVPCPMTGLIAVPNGSAAPAPLVVLIHGVHAGLDIYNDKNFAGFSYLVKQLAAQGFAVLSLNVKVQFSDGYGEPLDDEWAVAIYRQTIEALDEAVKAKAGSKSRFGFDLSGRIDLSRISLVGHSRGGGIIESIAMAEAKDSLNRINALVYLAPTNTYPTPPDVPLGVIVAEFDEDVAGDGQRVLDKATSDPARTAPAHLVFLRGANHAFFNSEMKHEAAALTREQQQDFTVHYVSHFLDTFVLGTEPSGTFDPGAPQPAELYGFKCALSFHHAQTAWFKVTSSLADLTAQGDATVEAAEQVINGPMLFRHAGDPDGLALDRLSWTSQSGQITWQPHQTDLSQAQAVSFWVAADSSDERNPKGQDQALSVTLSDAAGTTRTVTVPAGTPALTWHPGEAKHYFEPEIDVWEGLMPLSDLRLPLSLFDGLDLSRISQVDFAFDQTASGSIMLGAAWLDLK